MVYKYIPPINECPQLAWYEALRQVKLKNGNANLLTDFRQQYYLPTAWTVTLLKVLKIKADQSKGETPFTMFQHYKNSEHID